MTSFGSQYWFEYEFNELNQLVRVKKNGTLIGEYFYDHAGLRYMKVDHTAGKTTIYVYEQGAEPIYDEVYTTVGATTTVNKSSYLNLGMKRLARVEGGGISYYFADHLGSTRVVMDEAGKCTYNDYGPFGEDFGAASNGERYKFTGKEDEGVTGLQYYNARYYDSAIGRFISEDKKTDGKNWFVYCNNSPLIYVDRDGNEARSIVVDHKKYVFTSVEWATKNRTMTSKQYSNWEKQTTKSSKKWGEKTKSGEMTGIGLGIASGYVSKAVATYFGLAGAVIYLGSSYVGSYYETVNDITGALDDGKASFTLVKTITTVTVYNEVTPNVWEKAYQYDITSLHFQAETPDSDPIPITSTMWSSLINNSEKGTPYEPI